MAFTGTAVVTQISDALVRITGLSLAAGAAGTIALFPNAGTPGVRLPQAFKPVPYTYDEATVGLSDTIEVFAQAAAVGVATAIPVAIVKSGSSVAAFTATITNTHGSLATPNLEIYVRYH